MTPETYESLRNELIELLQNAVGLDAVSEDTRDTLTRICRKTLENQFEIVLVGEFQGGKSTTFNALCDGRELSPAGSGIKTSGCVVSAQNISTANEPETANLEWRCSKDLVAGFSDLLLPHLQTLAPRRFQMTDASGLGSVITLEDTEDRGLVAEAAQQEWQVWEKNKAGYDPEQKGRLDILRSASLIAHYYENAFLNQLRGKHTFSPEEIGRMIVFPEDWEERWMKKDPGRFDIEEVLFIFIHHIRLRLRSNNLGRLGCVITDCPGLFASRWDTEVARNAMFGADAILYLFDGSRTMKLSDLKALQFVRQNGMEYKLFFGCNMRSHTFSDSKRILGSTVTLLRNNGFQVQEHEFALFHALLALRSIQAEQLLNKKLDQASERQVGESPDKARKKLLKVINQQLSILDMDDDDYAEWNASALMSARNASGLDQLMGMVENTVVRNKARSVLIDNGSHIAANCLLEAEGALRTRETHAFEKEKEFRENVDLAEKELRKFDADAGFVIKRLDDDSPDYMLANDLWERLEKQKEGLCERTSERIYAEVAGNLSVSLFIEKKFRDKLIGIIKQEMDDSFTEVIHSWVSEIKDGKNVVYNAQMVRRIRTASMELKQIWENSALPDMNLFSGITIPEFSGNLELDNAKIFQELERSRHFDDIRYNAILSAAGLTGVFTATSGIFLAVFVLITRLFWVRIVTVVGFLVNIVLIFMTRGMVERSFKKKITHKLSATFTTLFYEIREDVKKEFQGFSSGTRELYKYMFLAAVGKPQKVFEERKAQAEADFKKSRKERESIAEQAKHIRKEQIQPLRMSLQEFVSQVETHLTC